MPRRLPPPVPWAEGARDQVGLTWRPRPFEARTETRLVPEGKTIQEMVRAAYPDEGCWPTLAVAISGRAYRLGLGEWEFRPRAGLVVEVAPLPGDRNILRTVLMLAVVAAAVATTVYTGGALGPVWASVLGATVSTVGMMTVNVLVPVEPPQMAGTGGRKVSSIYSLSGASNSARLDQPVRKVYGTHRLYPDLAAPWYTQLVGDDLYLHGLLDVGWAPLSVTAWKIGDTDFSAYSDLDYEVLDGVDGGVVQSSTLYPGSVVQDGLQGQSLRQADGWVTRTTRPGTETVSVDLGFAKGLIGYGKNTGDPLGADVDFQARWREAADPDAGTPAGPWSTPVDWTESGKTGSPTRRTRDFDMPHRQTWDFSLQRVTADHEDDIGATSGLPKALDAATWDSVRSINSDPPTTLPGVVRMAIKMRATKQNEGVLDKINCLASMIAPDWDAPTGTWVTRPTRSPAAGFREALQGSGVFQPTPDAQIALQDVEDWAADCAAQGYTFDFVEEREMGTLEVLKVAAAAGRASPSCPDGVWTVAVDRPKVASRQHFTPRNAKRITVRRIFVEQTHALRVTFVDRAQGYKAGVVRMVYADGYGGPAERLLDPSLAVATEIVDWEMPGVVEPDLIHRHGRKRLAEMRLRCLTAQVETSWEGWMVRRGDWVRMAQDVVEFGLLSARVLEVELSGHQVVAMTLDDDLLLDGATPMGVQARVPDGSGWTAALTRFAGRTRRLVLDAPVDQVLLADGSYWPDADCIVTVGRLDAIVFDILVTGITRSRGFDCVIQGCPLAPEVHTAEDGPIPPWAPRLTSPAGQTAPVIWAVTSDETALQRDTDGHLIVTAVVAFARDGTVPLARYDRVRVTWQVQGLGQAAQVQEWPADAAEVRLPGVVLGAVYSISAAYHVRGTDAYGPPSNEWLHQIVGANLPPPDTPDPYLAGDRVAVQYEDAPPDMDGYLWRVAPDAGTAWEDAQAVTDGPTKEGYILLVELPDGDMDVLVKAVRRTDPPRESANAGRMRLVGVDRPRVVEVFFEDLAAEGFPGELDGGSVVSGVLQAVDTSEWLGPQAAPWLSPQADPWLGGAFGGFTYVAHFTCPAGVRPDDRLRLLVTGTGTIAVGYRWPSDALAAIGRGTPLPPRATGLDPRWVPLGMVLTGDASALTFRPYLTGIRPQPGEVIDLRFEAKGGGAVRPTVSALRVTVEADLRVMPFPDFAVQPGGSQLVLPTWYRAVAYVTASLHQPSAASQVGPLDKYRAGGPVLIAYDSGGNTVGAVVDATAGYA